jgi:flavin reductase (DIM6/NTAB) family NADH-FMN oxidoreductase RutF
MNTGMKAHTDFTELLAADRDARANYMTLSSCVIPRPIAFVSTISEAGVPNLAPFSFFNAVGVNPLAVMFAPAAKRDGAEKDTIVNVRQVGEFVVNVVPFAIREAMNDTAYPFAPEVNEFEEAGFTPLPSKLVKPFRVAESPVHLECRVLQIVPVGEGAMSASMCIGEVLCFHVAGEVLLADGTVDVTKIDLLGRLGGDDYSTIRDRFSMGRPSKPDSRKR